MEGPIAVLETQSRALAQSVEARQAWIRDEGAASIPSAAHVWTRAVDGYLSSRGTDEAGKIVEAVVAEEHDALLERAVLCARILRNAVVGVQEAQTACFQIVPCVVETLWKTTSFAMQDVAEMQVLTRTLVQLLSNAVTQNDTLQSELFDTTLHVKQGSPEKTARGGADLIARLLQSGDAATSTAAQVLLLNCTLQSSERSRSICTTPAGRTIVSAMLLIIQAHLDDDERDDEDMTQKQAHQDGDSANHGITAEEEERERRHKRYESLGVMYAFFTSLFDQQLFGSLYLQLAPGDASDQGVAPSLISHAQLTLLKLLDSYLHFGAPTYAKDTADKSSPADLGELLVSFEALATWAEDAMALAVKAGAESKVDLRLVDVHVGLILLLQCLITLGLKTEQDSKEGLWAAAVELLSRMRAPTFVRNLVALLHTLSQFSPPVSPFKPTGSVSAPAPAGHALTSTGAATSSDPSRQGPSLDNLKRDIVNLLGVLSYGHSSQDRASVETVQDTVRESGGLFDVLNMTQLDERNPYMRERAIFALRNLLRGNQASQDLIAQLKPIAT